MEIYVTWLWLGRLYIFRKQHYIVRKMATAILDREAIKYAKKSQETHFGKAAVTGIVIGVTAAMLILRSDSPVAIQNSTPSMSPITTIIRKFQAADSAAEKSFADSGLQE